MQPHPFTDPTQFFISSSGSVSECCDKKTVYQIVNKPYVLKAAIIKHKEKI